MKGHYPGTKRGDKSRDRRTSTGDFGDETGRRHPQSSAESDLARLQREIDETQRRITELKKLQMALSPFVEADQSDDAGIGTDASEPDGQRLGSTVDRGCRYNRE